MTQLRISQFVPQNILSLNVFKSLTGVETSVYASPLFYQTYLTKLQIVQIELLFNKLDRSATLLHKLNRCQFEFSLNIF